jgi:hypothetical protein
MPGDPLPPEEAKALSLLVSACAHALKSTDSALTFRNDQRVLDPAGWLANHWDNESSVLSPEQKMAELSLQSRRWLSSSLSRAEDG